MTNTLVIEFKCRKCNGSDKNVEDHEEKVHEDVETETDFSYLGDIIFFVYNIPLYANAV